MKQASPFCPNIAATPDGEQVWFTLKDIGKTQVFNARPPFNLIKTIDTGPITNHVNFVHNAKGTFAYVTIGGLNQVKVFRTDDSRRSRPFRSAICRMASGRRATAAGLCRARKRRRAGRDRTATNKVIANIPIGQAAQAITYVPNAVPDGDGTAEPAAARRRRRGGPPHAGGRGEATGKAPTSVSLFDQGLIQVLQASVTGLQPKQPYVLALAAEPDGGGELQPLAAFMTNPAGSAIVNAVGPIRQIVQTIPPGASGDIWSLPPASAKFGDAVQVQAREVDEASRRRSAR